MISLMCICKIIMPLRFFCRGNLFGLGMLLRSLSLVGFFLSRETLLCELGKLLGGLRSVLGRILRLSVGLLGEVCSLLLPCS
jgi:hypothetical protein